MYRITKYNPQNRDANGAYLLNEWTSFSDIGKSFDGTILDESEYFKVEDKYIGSALFFLRETGVYQLIISSLENIKYHFEPGLKNLKQGQIFELQDLEQLFRLVFREKIWCKFEWHDQAFVH
jgi:hypothetical protein